MTKEDRQQKQLNNVSAGHHLGGTRFGQQPGDANLKESKPEHRKGGKTRLSDGKTS